MAKKQNIDPFEVGKWILLGSGVFLIYKTLKGLGLIKTGAEAQAEAQEQQAESTNLTIDQNTWTKIDFWKKAPKGYTTLLMPVAGANYIAKQVWDSYGTFNDNEEQMQGALKMIRYKTQYSQVADRFVTIYKEDLTLFLKAHFSATELFPVWDHLEKLPSGFVKKK